MSPKIAAMPIRILPIVLTAIITVTTAPCIAAEGLRLQLQRVQTELTVKRTQLLAAEKKLILTGENLPWNDLLYINNIIVSLNTIETCLYYQSELLAVYQDVGRFNENYLHSELRRMVQQIDFTLGSLDIEQKKISYQYLQIIDPTALGIIAGLRKDIDDTRKVLSEHLKWLDTERNRNPEGKGRNTS